MQDNINPNHYKSDSIECIDAIEAAVVGKDPFSAVCVANVMKYIWRSDKKGKEIEDLRKAQWYLQRLIDHKENGNTK